VADVSVEKDVKNWIDSVIKASSQIDVIVSNVSALAMNDEIDGWNKSFNTDILGTKVFIDAALPHLEKTKGCIVNIGSVSGRDIDFTAPSPYGAMKAALIHYMSQLAHALAPKGVRVNTVSPGNTYIKDGVWGSIERDQPDVFNRELAKNIMGRMAKPEEIADAVVWIASSRASFVSGIDLVVDGALCTGVQF
jgi:3-oxoacyl-[acyl-carrier protein] reductase